MRTSPNLIQPKATVSSHSTPEPEAAKQAAAQIHHDEFVLQTASLRPPTTSHYEAEIMPKDKEHYFYLTGCAAYEGSMEGGIVQTKLDAKFWPWLKSQDPDLILQCYADATLLSGETPSKLVDRIKMLDESGLENKWSQADIKKISAEHKIAFLTLKALHKKQSEKPSPLSCLLPKGLVQPYSKGTGGGDLKHDYLVYCRSVEFRDRLVTFADMAYPALSQNALDKLVSRDHKHAALVVIALMRLQHERLMQMINKQ